MRYNVSDEGEGGEFVFKMVVELSDDVLPVDKWNCHI